MENYRPLDFDSGDIPFACREYCPSNNIHAEKKSHDEIKSVVLGTPRMRKVMQDIAKESGCDLKAVEKETETLLDEIGHKLSAPAVRFAALCLRGVLRRILSGIYVNQSGVDRLSSLCKQWPVVLVPSHRSYLDFILVSYILFEHNLPLPCIAAGLDFMGMAGVSSLLRHCGAFFLRRTFGSDHLYKATFSEYVKTLLCSRESPMEFFVEGTRSRSGKSLHPRLGLLSMVIEPYLEGRVPDILMVPFSISYERTLEELLFAREQLGVPKPKESTSGLFKAYSLLSEDYGSIYVTIGEAISVHSFCVDQGISRVPHSLLPRETSMLLPEEWRMVKELGHHIVDRLHGGVVIFPSAIVAALLISCSGNTSWSKDKLSEYVQWLCRQLLHRGATLSPRPEMAAIAAAGLEKLEASVHMLGLGLTLNFPSGPVQIPVLHPPPAGATSSSSVASSSHDHTHNRASRPSHRERLSDLYSMKIGGEPLKEVIYLAHVHVTLGHYRNQLLHVFLQDSLVALTLEEEVTCETAFERYQVLRSALASEFVLSLQSSKDLFEEGVDTFIKRGQVSYSPGRTSLLLQPCHDGDRLLDFLRNLLLPFVSCMYVVCHQLLSLRGGVQSLGVTVKHAQLLAASAVWHGLIESYEALSLTIIKNGLASLHQAGLILQASNEYGTGHDRLVKVVDERRLLKVTKTLGEICRIKEIPNSHL